MNVLINSLRALFLLGLCALAFWAMNQLFIWSADVGPAMRLPTRLLVMGLYAIFICTPFLPSFHLSLAFMLLQGPEQILWIYCATVVGFCLPFFVGWLIPSRYLVDGFRRLGLRRVADLVAKTHALPIEDRLAMITDMAPKRLKLLVNRWRYVAFFIALNFPGNVVIGGAGGILMVAGLSRLFHPVPVLLIIVISLCPIPLMISLTGFDVLVWLGFGPR